MIRVPPSRIQLLLISSDVADADGSLVQNYSLYVGPEGPKERLYKCKAAAYKTWIIIENPEATANNRQLVIG